MNSGLLYWPSMLVAVVGGAVVAVSGAYEPARMMLAPLALLAGAIVTLLFLRILLDPRCHRGIEAANREMMGEHGFQFRLTPILDPQWGIFGSRGGTPLHMTVRAFLILECIVVMLLPGDATSLVLLAFGSLGIVMLLSMLHAARTSQATGA